MSDEIDPPPEIQSLRQAYRTALQEWSSEIERLRAENERLAAENERLAKESIETYYARQIEWSRTTFGPALRTKGLIDHITKELREIANNPHDLSEWIDVAILAMDGFWRHGGQPEDLMPALLAKQKKNMARKWPDWREKSEDSAIEHDRSGEADIALEGKEPRIVT